MHFRRYFGTLLATIESKHPDCIDSKKNKIIKSIKHKSNKTALLFRAEHDFLSRRGTSVRVAAHLQLHPRLTLLPHFQDDERSSDGEPQADIESSITYRREDTHDAQGSATIQSKMEQGLLFGGQRRHRRKSSGGCSIWTRNRESGQRAARESVRFVVPGFIGDVVEGHTAQRRQAVCSRQGERARLVHIEESRHRHPRTAAPGKNVVSAATSKMWYLPPHCKRVNGRLRKADLRERRPVTTFQQVPYNFRGL